MLGTLTEIMTKKMVNCCKKKSRTFPRQNSENSKFQDKKNSRTFPGFPGFPGRLYILYSENYLLSSSRYHPKIIGDIPKNEQKTSASVLMTLYN